VLVQRDGSNQILRHCSVEWITQRAFAWNCNETLNSLCLFPFSIMYRNTHIWPSHSAMLFSFIFASFLFFHSFHFPSFQKYLLWDSLDQMHSTPFLYPLMLPFSCLKSMQLIFMSLEFLFPSLKIHFSNFPNFVHPLILTLFLFVPLGALLMKCLCTIKCFKPN
jgi:hypothetical protein